MKILTQYEINDADRFDVTFFKEGNIKAFDGSDAEIIICSRATAREIIKYNFPALKLLQLNSAGFENIPLEEYAKKGVYVCNAGAIYAVCMAETVVFGVLQVEKRLREDPNNRRFKITRGYNLIGELKGKKAVMLGAGNIAVQVAKRLNAFDVECYGYDPYCAEKPEFVCIIRDRDGLKKLLTTVDYIINTIPLLDDTVGFVDNELISAMKKTAVFVNVARMATVNKADLFEALKKKSIAYAVLDMFEKIPNPFTNKFRRLKNTVVLPGVSAISKESKENLKVLFAENALRIARKERPLNVVNGLK